MYRSRLLPQRLAMLGLVRGPLVIASGFGVMFDLFDAGGSVQTIAAAPEILWELSLCFYPP
jgi:hypothetical protein